MKRTIKLAVVAALALGTTSAFATNGDIMIGQGAQSRAMGGVGIAKSFGASSGLANPALLSSVKSSEFTAGITAFMPDIDVRSTNNLTASGGAVVIGAGAQSKADLSYIPELYYAKRINKNLVYGITIAGVAGMGMDSDGTTAATANVNRMTTNLQLMKIAVPVSYQMNALTLGIAPVLLRGTLEISHSFGFNAGSFVNNGQAGDTSLGYEVGAVYDVSSSLTLGAVYKSKIAMTYANTISASIVNFGISTGANSISSGDKLDQPAEYGVGASYTFGGSTIAADYKHIAWEDASGYADFGWQDQDVFIIGYEFATKKWALRAGYNYAKSPIKDQSGTGGGFNTTAYKADVQDFFNLSGFPGIVESHYTFGAGYNVSEALSMDVAVVYAAENKETFDIGQSGNFGADATIETKHSQLGITIAATYKF